MDTNAGMQALSGDFPLDHLPTTEMEIGEHGGLVDFRDHATWSLDIRLPSKAKETSWLAKDSRA